MKRRFWNAVKRTKNNEMKRMIKYILSAVFAVVWPMLSFAGGDPVSGKWKAQTCLGCHGIPTYGNVYPSYHVPRLAGQHADYIAAALQAYRNGERGHKTMVAQSHRLNDQDTLDVAAYFASLDSAPADPQVSVPEELQQLVTTCAACHGNDGNGPVTIYPKIAGQFEDYLYHSFLAYKQGTRKNAIMVGISAMINEKDALALARYFAGNPGLGEIEVGIGAGAGKKQ